MSAHAAEYADDRRRNAEDGVSSPADVNADPDQFVFQVLITGIRSRRYAAGLDVTTRVPAAISNMPAISDAPTLSSNASAEIRMPRLGAARSAVERTEAGKWRPTSTTAQ